MSTLWACCSGRPIPLHRLFPCSSPTFYSPTTLKNQHREDASSPLEVSFSRERGSRKAAQSIAQCT